MLVVNVIKKFTGFKLEIDFKVTVGFNVLFGPSGSGKSTTLNLISGLLTPDTGEIKLEDVCLYSSRNKISMKPQQRNIGYIFQESRLFPHLTVEKNLKYGFSRIPKNNRRFSLREVVEITGIDPHLSRMPDSLSGGEKQRVAVARALLASPDYLLLDEPLASLDLPTRLVFLHFLKKIHSELSLPILYVSHDLATVLNFADEAVVLQNGRNIAQGNPDAILEKLHPNGRDSFQESLPNIFEVEVISDSKNSMQTEVRLGTANLVLPHLQNPPRKLLLNVPASEIILATQRPLGLSASNILNGRISAIRKIDERVIVDVDSAERFTVEIVPQTITRLKLRPGMQVYLIMKATSFRVLTSGR